MKILTLFSAIAAGMLVTSSANSAVNDIFPADFVALPPETVVATTYLFDKASSGPISAGQKTNDWHSRAQTAAIRLSKFKQFADTVVVAGYTQQQLSGEGIPDYINRSAAGLRDIRFNGTAWWVNDPESRNYLATNVTWMLPSGKYSAGDVQNVGENRHQLATSVAWFHGIGQRWNVEVIGEFAWYSSNNSFYPNDVKQDKAPTRSLTTYARYAWANNLETYVGYEWNGGGNTYQNDVDQNDPAKWERAMIGLICPASPTSLFNLRFARDFRVESGFSTDVEIAMRLLFFY
jgi:Putative MetA-pathway of phenol degradation